MITCLLQTPRHIHHYLAVLSCCIPNANIALIAKNTLSVDVRMHVDVCMHVLLGCPQTKMNYAHLTQPMSMNCVNRHTFREVPEYLQGCILLELRNRR